MAAATAADTAQAEDTFTASRPCSGGDGPDSDTPYTHIVATRTSSSVERALWMRRLARKDEAVERAELSNLIRDVFAGLCLEESSRGSTMRGLRGATCCITPGEDANLLMSDAPPQAVRLE